MSINTSSNLPAVVLQSIMPGMLAVPTPENNYTIPAERMTMKAHSGTTARALRAVPLVPPVERFGYDGIDPNSQILQREIVDATMSFHGTSIVLNEECVLQAQDPLLAWSAERLEVAYKAAEDIILRDFLLSTASQYNARSGLSGDNPSNLTKEDVSLLCTSLSSSSGLKITAARIGEDRFGTGPLRAAYIMLCHTEMEHTFNSMPDFNHTSGYSNNKNIGESEFGQILNAKILTSPQAAVQQNASDLGFDVYNNILTAYQGYCHLDQDGYEPVLKYRDARFSGPNCRNSSLAINFAQAQMILQEVWIRNVRCTLGA